RSRALTRARRERDGTVRNDPRRGGLRRPASRRDTRRGRRHGGVSRMAWHRRRRSSTLLQPPVERGREVSAHRLVFAVLLVAGCSILAPRPDPFRFVVLTPLTDTDATSPRRDGLVVGVGPVALPGYLRRPEMATRVAPNRIAFSDTVRWA